MVGHGHKPCATDAEPECVVEIAILRDGLSAELDFGEAIQCPSKAKQATATRAVVGQAQVWREPASSRRKIQRDGVLGRSARADREIAGKGTKAYGGNVIDDRHIIVSNAGTHL